MNRFAAALLAVVVLASVALVGCGADGASRPGREGGAIRELGAGSRLPGGLSLAREGVVLPGRPIDAAGGAGSLWILTRSTHRRPGHLVRIDPRRRRLVSSTAIAGPQAIAFGWGSVWVAQFFRNRVVRLNARTGRMLTTIWLSLPHPISDTPDGRDFLPFDIAAGEGAVWVSTARGQVARIDPQTDRVSEQIAVPFESSAAIAAGEGGVWIAGNLNGAIRIDPESGKELVIPIRGPEGRRLTITTLGLADGRVWATGAWARPTDASGRPEYVASNEAALVELSPRGQVLSTVSLPPGVGIVTSTGDSTWLSAWRSRDVFVRRGGTRAVVRAFRLPVPGQVIAALGGALWIAGSDNMLVPLAVAGST